MTQSRAARNLAWPCLAYFSGLLIAGWWPFNFLARNQVSWLKGRNGVQVERYGEIYSPGVWAAQPGWEAFSLEVGLRGSPDYATYSPVVFIGDPGRPGSLVIAQSLSDLVIEGQFQDQGNRVRRAKFWLDGACNQGQPRFLAITSGQQGTTIYLDGRAVNFNPELKLTADSFSGRLLLGHGPEGQEPWSGELLGLAFYPRTLTREEVSADSRAWQESGSQELGKGAAAFYAFDEGGSAVVHDRTRRMPDLIIPRDFHVLHSTPLELPSNPGLSDLRDAAVNVVGFIPFGFLLAAYLQVAAGYSWRQALIATVALGLVTSLGIELLQVYLPTRDSSLLDVINNTLGSVAGALLPSSVVLREWWSRRVQCHPF